jgi:transcriptional regulator with XRE-family HTH domain
MNKSTSLSKEMKKIRIDRDISLIKMAKKMNVSPQYISGIETGKFKVAPDFFGNICSTLELTEEEKLTVFNAILELDKNYFAEVVNDEQKKLLIMIYDLFKKLRNTMTTAKDEIIKQVEQIKIELDKITKDATTLGLFNFVNM